MVWVFALLTLGRQAFNKRARFFFARVAAALAAQSLAMYRGLHAGREDHPRVKSAHDLVRYVEQASQRYLQVKAAKEVCEVRANLKRCAFPPAAAGTTVASTAVSRSFLPVRLCRRVDRELSDGNSAALCCAVLSAAGAVVEPGVLTRGAAAAGAGQAPAPGPVCSWSD